MGSKSLSGCLALSFYLLTLLSGCASSPLPTQNKILVAQFEEGELVADETNRGVVVYLPNAFFDFDSSELTDLAQDKIQFVAKISNGEIAADRLIAVEGHSDSQGDTEYNLALSKSRAVAAADFLAHNGVTKNRIQIDWVGESRPRVPNKFANGSDNPNARETNRRVEIIILNL